MLLNAVLRARLAHIKSRNLGLKSQNVSFVTKGQSLYVELLVFDSGKLPEFQTNARRLSKVRPRSLEAYIFTHKNAYLVELLREALY